MYTPDEEKKKASQLAWYQKNKERLQEKARNYYEANKGRIQKRSRNFVICPLCNTGIRQGALSHHKKTQKCKDLRAFRQF